MNIAAATLLLIYTGLLNFNGAVAEDYIKVRMSSNQIVEGRLLGTAIEPDWMIRGRDQPDFRNYKVFIRTDIGSHVMSGILGTKERIDTHVHSRDLPVEVRAIVFMQDVINDGGFNPYDHTAPPTYLDGRDYLFITIPRSKNIYYALLQRRFPIKRVLPLEFVDAVFEKKAASVESSKRSRHLSPVRNSMHDLALSGNDTKTN